MGRFITLPGVNPTLDRPKIDAVDPILPPTAGALLLVDPTHPVSAWAAGVPGTVGQPLSAAPRLPNLAEAQAAPLLGGGGPTDRGAAIRWDTNFNGARALMERTAKGGLHGIVSQSGEMATPGTAANIGYSIVLPVSVIAYIRANLGHSFFVSQWGRSTRSATGLTSGHTQSLLTLANAAFTSHLEWSINHNGIAPAAGARIGARNGGLLFNPEAGPVVRNVAVNAYSGTNTGASDASVSSGASSVATWGQHGVFNNYGPNTGKAFSWVFYRAYIEDLTVSGRTYAAVDALDNSLFTRDVLTAGGRYYGDTFTDPATLA